MLRVKIAAGVLKAAQLRVLADICGRVFDGAGAPHKHATTFNFTL